MLRPITHTHRHFHSKDGDAHEHTHTHTKWSEWAQYTGDNGTFFGMPIPQDDLLTPIHPKHKHAAQEEA